MLHQSAEMRKRWLGLTRGDNRGGFRSRRGCHIREGYADHERNARVDVEEVFERHRREHSERGLRRKKQKSTPRINMIHPIRVTRMGNGPRTRCYVPV